MRKENFPVAITVFMWHSYPMASAWAGATLEKKMDKMSHPWLENGGPAFPVELRDGNGFKGMSLRDYFAAKALGGMASAYHEHWTIERLAEAAYELADAMLAERAK